MSAKEMKKKAEEARAKSSTVGHREAMGKITMAANAGIDRVMFFRKTLSDATRRWLERNGYKVEVQWGDTSVGWNSPAE
jgi:hypothetical protein